MAEMMRGDVWGAESPFGRDLAAMRDRVIARDEAATHRSSAERCRLWRLANHEKVRAQALARRLSREGGIK
jgi:hypothetical protein